MSYKTTNSRMSELPESFMENVRVDEASGCWVWVGRVNNHGYGKVSIMCMDFYTHRVSYQYHRGDIPSGICVCHRCDNPPCVNPEHLFLGTKKENSRDSWNKGRGRLQVPNPLRGKGEMNGRAKMTVECVKEIRRLRAEGHLQSRIGAQFGITQSAVHRICSRKLWGDVA